MKIHDVMTREVQCVSPDDTLKEAARIMLANNVGALVACDASGAPVGVLTDRDVTLTAYRHGGTLHNIRVRVGMSQPVWTIGPDEDIDHAAAMMREHQVHRLPVVDDTGMLRGVVSTSDIVHAVLPRPNKHRLALDTIVSISRSHAAQITPRNAEPAT